MSTLDRRTFLIAGTLAAAGLGLAACTPEGDWVRLEASAIESLRRRIEGIVLVPGDTGFTNAWLPKNGRFADAVPQLVVRVAGDADVATCLDWAGDHGLPIAVRGGGHNYAGLSTTTGLVIDLSRLAQVRIDDGTGTMTAGGAATNRDVFEASRGGRWLLPGGTCLSVGLGGLALGGGIGYHSRWAGLTSDHLRSARLVTAAGEVVTASEREHPELFWALRGGTGGTFGVCTEFEFDLAPVPRRDVVYYRFGWTGADAALELLTALDRIHKTAPPEFVASAGMQATPIEGNSPRQAMDVFVRGQFLGTEDDFRAIAQPLLDAAPATSDLRVEPFWEVAPRFTNPESENHSWGDISRYADAPIPESAFERIVELLADAPSRSEHTNAQFWMLGWVGGDVIDAIGRTDTAYVHRGMTALLRPTPVWSNLSDAAVVADLEAWTGDVIAVLDPHTPRESYQNFPNRGIEDWPEQYFAENLGRLREVKAAWDPDGVFTSVQGLPGPGS